MDYSMRHEYSTMEGKASVSYSCITIEKEPTPDGSVQLNLYTSQSEDGQVQAFRNVILEADDGSDTGSFAIPIADESTQFSRSLERLRKKNRKSRLIFFSTLLGLALLLLVSGTCLISKLQYFSQMENKRLFIGLIMLSIPCWTGFLLIACLFYMTCPKNCRFDDGT